ncbi:2-hydroxyacid dehydrogenase [Mucisphaera sp.]|uniref:2-hydroxyacid dehydrogenase n=1 Tax=Mucisphaera sp. TaxID=2913024 RepID=UPI003D136D97
MKTAVFSARPYDRRSLNGANERAGRPHSLDFLDDLDSGSLTGPRLTPRSAGLASGYEAACVFTNDDLSRETLSALAEGGCQTVVLRCAGYNNLDIDSAKELGFRVARVPAYSPHAVAEHTVGLLLSINRKIHRAHQRVREQNFSLDGLLGSDLHGKTATVVGAGAIGAVLLRILQGFGCKVIAVDPNQSQELLAAGVEYRSLERALPSSTIVCLTCPLNDHTHRLINQKTISLMPKGTLLVNTARGEVVDTHALIQALKDDHFSGVALDVYEEEQGLFFEDRSSSILQDDTFARLLTFSNVLVTSHQAFFTREALDAIAATTIENLSSISKDGTPPNRNRIPGMPQPS